MLVELPLASFFLSKLLGQHLMNVDIDHLYSLDPELHKNLLYLKTYDGDVQAEIRTFIFFWGGGFESLNRNYTRMGAGINH